MRSLVACFLGQGTAGRVLFWRGSHHVAGEPRPAAGRTETWLRIGAAALFLTVAAGGTELRRGPRPQALQSPYPRARHHRLQAQRRLRPRRPAVAQRSSCATGAQNKTDQDGPAPARPDLAGLQGVRVARLHPGGVRLPLAADQRHAPPPLARRRQEQPAHARQGDGLLHSRRAARQAARHRPAGCRSAASASIRPPARPSSTWTPAACATGRA